MCVYCKCGETFYPDEVACRLEEIVNKAKKFLQEISVIDYRNAA